MLSSARILELFESLNERLKARDISASLHLVGGAVMCLVHQTRASTHDVDGQFVPAKIVRDLAKEVGLEKGISEKWLNDGVKGFFSDSPSFDHFKTYSNLEIFCAKAEYLLAMKCLSMRIGEEFHDEADIRFLLRLLDLETVNEVYEVICEFYAQDRFPVKTQYALKELLES